MKISIVIADEDSLYLKQLTNYLVKETDNFEVYAFGSKGSLCSFLADGTVEVDILLLTEGMICPETDNCAAVKILLAEDNWQHMGYESVAKYQKTADLLKQVTLVFGTHSSRADELIRGTRSSKIIGVYSPVGGSGKTSIALLLAHCIGLRGKRAFYLNYERVDSTRELLAAKAQIGVSELLVAVHAKEQNIGLSLLTKLYEAPKLGFAYVNPADSGLEFNEVPLDEQMELVSQLSRTNSFDAVILDFDSELSIDKLQLLGCCDSVVTPFLPDVISLNKLKQFLHELKLRGEENALLGKTQFVGNKMGTNLQSYLQQSGLPEQCLNSIMLPVSAALANVTAAMQNESADLSGLTALLERLGL